ncbi:MAG TPA: FAD-binding oxidoreductase, partial [Chitinophaga sp.]
TMEHIVKIISLQDVTHNVRRYRFTKPAGYHFEPGQATDVSIHQPSWKDEVRPFTFTCLNEDDFLEFTIKSYHDHNGVTHALSTLQVGDELIIRDVWGAIAYQGEGYFLAGGAGITPFLAILRQLKKDNAIAGNHLYFSNQTTQDIILKAELDSMLGNQVHYLISREAQSAYPKGRIDRAFLQNNIRDFSKPFYICGLDKMVSDLAQTLQELGAPTESVVFEK